MSVPDRKYFVTVTSVSIYIKIIVGSFSLVFASQVFIVTVTDHLSKPEEGDIFHDHEECSIKSL